MYNVQIGCRVLLSLYVFAFFECTRYVFAFVFFFRFRATVQFFLFCCFPYVDLADSQFFSFLKVLTNDQGGGMWVVSINRPKKILYTSADFKIFVKDPGSFNSKKRFWAATQQFMCTDQIMCRKFDTGATKAWFFLDTRCTVYINNQG
jgi:hypothetical protein